MKILRQIGSFILPFTVLVIVPYLIVGNPELNGVWATITGCVFMLVGLSTMVLTIRMFIQIGMGTLAPWDPTRKLVTKSLYAYVRNPMILGVFIVLVGEAIFLVSWGITIWAAAFFVINTVYFVYSEEPGLVKRFGQEYIEYKSHVPRWVPRIRPWKPL